MLVQEQQRDPFSKGQILNTPMTILGLLNGMIGTSCLLLPIIGITAGYITTIWVCLVIGYISYYTAYLIVLHMGKGKNVKDCILAHFKFDYKFMRAYSFFMWLSFVPTLFGYFRIICLQIVGLLGYQSPWIAPIVAVFLILLVLLVRNLHFWQEILAYGITSIIALLIFLIWAWITAPSGPKAVPPNGQIFILASVLVGAYQIHDFLAQNIIKNPNKSQYPLIVRCTFLIGAVVFISVTMGSFALVNRQPVVKNPQVLSEYFQHGQWQVFLIQLVYIVHTASAFPTYLIVSKIRFYQMFKIDLERSLQLKDIIYILIAVLMSYGVYVSGMNLISIYAINGAVIGYIYVFFIPIWIHLKCVWYDRSSGYIQGDQEWNERIVANTCNCQNSYSSKTSLYLETFLLCFMLIIGLLMIVFTLKQVLTPKN